MSKEGIKQPKSEAVSPKQKRANASKRQLPNYSIERIRGEAPIPEEIIAMRFGEYLSTRNYLFHAHRHTFYHVVYFSKGAGRHSIDFAGFPVEPGQIYFMNPGQVHH
ncbi:AraC family ligand binding domain-containing protein [Flavitalea flava]